MNISAASIGKLTALFLACFLISCGGGGGGDAPAATSPPPTPPPPVTSAGVFLDSPVEGLTYQSDGNPPGTTDENGTFMYTPGETLTFSVGGVVLGTLPDGAPLITPNDFGAAAENIARFLQTLDADGDPSNGIDITAAGAALAGTTLGDAVFLSDAITFENDIGTVLEVALGAGAVLIDAATALANLAAATDTTFDVAELAGHAFVVVLPDQGDVGLLIFAPLVNPGDSGSTVLSFLRSDSLATGGDGTVAVENWSVDADGILVVTDPITSSTTRVEKVGGSAHAISFVAREDSAGSAPVVGTLLVPVAVTVADLAGQSGKTYDVVDASGASLVTFLPNGTLTVIEDGAVSIETWEIDPNGVLVTVLNPANQEVALFVLKNGSFATGGDILVVDATNLSSDPAAPVLQLDSVSEASFTPHSAPSPQPGITSVEIELLDLINAERAIQAPPRPALERDVGMDRIILWHVTEMANRKFLSHIDKHGRESEGRARAYGDDPRIRCLEIIQWWSGTASGRVHYNGYKASPSHRAGYLEQAPFSLGPTMWAGVAALAGTGPDGSAFAGVPGSYTAVMLCEHPVTLIVDPFATSAP